MLGTSGQQNDLLSSKVRKSLIGHLIGDIQSSKKVNKLNVAEVHCTLSPCFVVTDNSIDRKTEVGIEARVGV